MDPTFVVMGSTLVIVYLGVEFNVWWKSKKCMVVKVEVRCEDCYWLKVNVCEGMVWWERWFSSKMKCGNLWLG